MNKPDDVKYSFKVVVKTSRVHYHGDSTTIYQITLGPLKLDVTGSSLMAFEDTEKKEKYVAEVFRDRLPVFDNYTPVSYQQLLHRLGLALGGIGRDLTAQIIKSTLMKEGE